MKSELVELVRRNGKVAATDLAILSGRHKSTISPQVQALLASGVLREAGQGSPGAKGGKPRQYLELNPDYCYAIGIDASAAHLKGGIYDLRGRQILVGDEHYSNQHEGQAFLDDLYGFIAKMIAAAEGLPGSCLGVGIGFSGLIDSRAGRIFRSRSIGLRDYDLVSDIKRRFGLPACVQNDANAALLGEKWFHLDYAARGAKDILYFFIDNYFTSVGFGIMIRGSLYEGAQSFAGELTNYGMAMGVGPELVQAMDAFDASALACIDDEHPLPPEVLRVFDIFASELIFVVELLNPELLVVGGNFEPGHDFFLGPFVAYTKKRFLSSFEPSIAIDIRESGIAYPPVCAGATVPLFQALIGSL